MGLPLGSLSCSTVYFCFVPVPYCLDDCLVQLLSHVRLFVISWTAACQACLSIISSQNLLRLMSIKSVMPSNHFILYRPLLSAAVNLSQHQGLFQ